MSWSVEKSNLLYKIDKWGEKFFEISSTGDLVVNVEKRENGPKINLAKVIEEIKREGLAFPVVIRFHDILRSKIIEINKVFSEKISEANYNGKFYGVYPIKVNQMREVVEEIVDAGAPYDFGLEAGSKSELLAVLAYNNNSESLTILNGYKDDEYIELALLGRKLGRKMIIVIEKLSELDRVIYLAKKMKVTPLIGIRAKIFHRGSGRWCDSGGERAKFGLSLSELIIAVDKLKENDLENSFKLLHFHIGSQITDIRCIKEAISEAARIYINLKRMDIPLEFMDVGGGLGVDYDGTRSLSDSSKNYHLEEYASDIVYTISQICDLEGIEHPNIVTESGRAVTAHHSCVITNVIDVIKMKTTGVDISKEENEHILVKNMRELWTDFNNYQNYQEIYNANLEIKDDSVTAFKLGVLSLGEKAKIDTLSGLICEKIISATESLEEIPESLLSIYKTMAPQYLCNFSVFQSAADSWAIKQKLPIIPVSNLDKKPEVLCTIADITCDSDGKISQFIGNNHNSSLLPIHPLPLGEDYYVGLFLTGAYQDVMGDMHNLFGRLNEVHIFSDDEDPTDFYIEEVIYGNTTGQVLSSMQYSPSFMAQVVKSKVDALIKEGKIRPREGVQLINYYENSLNSYTYLKN